MRIAFFSDGLQPFVVGGIQRHSYYFCKFMARLGVTIDLFHTSSDNQKPDLSTVFTPEELSNINDHFIEFPKHKKLPGHYVRESHTYSKLVYEKFLALKDDIDFVYSKNYTSWYYIEQKKNKGHNLPPIGVMLHGYEVHQLKEKKLRTIKNTYFHKKPTNFNTLHADYVFSYGGKITDIIRKIGVPNQKIIEIPSGIDSTWIDNKREVPDSNDTINFVFLGRYAPRKGITLIYKWLNNNLNKNFKINFIGPIPEDKQIKDSKIIYHGKVTDSEVIQGLLSSSDVLLCPSRSEGMPNVIIEGMARGCAILATDVGAVAALVNDENGWLLPPFDQESFDDTMNEILMSDRSDIFRKGEKSIEKITKSFTWEAIARKTLAEIERVTLIH